MHRLCMLLIRLLMSAWENFAIRESMLDAGQQQSVAPVADHVHGVLTSLTDVLWDSYLVTWLAIPSSEYHVA